MKRSFLKNGQVDSMRSYNKNYGAQGAYTGNGFLPNSRVTNPADYTYRKDTSKMQAIGAFLGVKVRMPC